LSLRGFISKSYIGKGKEMDQIINLRDFHASTLEERLRLAKREYPGMKIIYVGRPTALGNPYELFGQDKHNPKKVAASIARYKVWLWGKIKEEDPDVMFALKNITEDTILACWCYPSPCHSQVIWAAWHYLKCKERVSQQEGAQL